MNLLFAIQLLLLIATAQPSRTTQHGSAIAGSDGEPARPADVARMDTSRIYHLDPVVVTATKIEVARSNVAASVSVISIEDLGVGRSGSILSAVNTRVPGLFVQQRGVQGFGVASGSAGQIHIRGLGGTPNTRVLVLLDGRPQFMGLFGHPIPDTYLSSHVERVEVIRGPSSLLYGTNAMGGVMNIITRRSETDGLTAHGSASVGSYNTQNYTGGFGFRDGGIDVRGSYTYNGTGGQRAFSDHYLNSGFLKAGRDLGENFSLTIDGMLTHINTYDPGPQSAPRIDNWLDILRGSGGFVLDNRFGGTQGSAKFLYTFGEHNIHDGFRSKDQNAALLMYQTFAPLRNNRLVVGVDYKYYGGRAENIDTGADFGSHHLNETGVYFFTQHTLTDMIILNGGLRIENGDVLDNELVPQFGAVYRAGYRTSIRGSVAKAFRSPTMQELFLFPPSNPDLEPERLWNYELGILHTFPNAVQVEATGYIADGTDAIRTVGVPPNVQFENTGTFTHRGVELSGRLPIIERLMLHTSYSYLDPGDQTRSNPRHTLFAELTWRERTWQADLQVQHVNRIFGLDNSLQRMNDYTLLNVKLTVRPFDGVSVYISGENLLDERYSTIYDYPIRGRLLFTGLSFNI
jgi:outer membrane receptor protein involved in Fe transport